MQRHFDRFARHYDKSMGFMERALFPSGRAWIGSRASGEVLEIAIGTGLNLPYYPSEAHITGVDISAAMLEVARKRAASRGLEVDLIQGDVQELDFTDGIFDTAVSTLSLCTVPDPSAAVSEVRRVLKPGGRFVLLEHVRSPYLPVRIAEHALEPLTLWFEGDHLLREPLEFLVDEGFRIEDLSRSKLGIMERVEAVRAT